MSDITDLVPGRRWPLHPKPRKEEMLNAWVPRIASAYGVRFDTFLREALGRTGPGARNMDNLTEVQLAMLASGTGVPVERLRSMNSRLWLENSVRRVFSKRSASPRHSSK